MSSAGISETGKTGAPLPGCLPGWQSMRREFPKTPLPVAGWIVLCAFLNCAGWALSAVHLLNPAGYSSALAAGLIVFMVWWKQTGAKNLSLGGFAPFKLARRFRRPFSLAFLILAALAFLGGAIHAPANYDGLAYRTPRVLNWLAEGRWHWIHTTFERLNVRAAGFEWVTAPMILFTRTDRCLFLVNIICFLLLPGLVFSMFTRLGVRPKAAWYWMWLLPSGYGFLLQAGSIGNDLFGAVLAIAALDFALRARAFGRAGDLWLSALAAALCTGGKTSNLPLLLPWLVAALPSLRLLAQKPVASAAVMLAAGASSFLPMAVANYRNCGDWTGQAAEKTQFMKGLPVLHLTQNAALLAIHNLTPPVFPMANAWNNLMEKITPPARQATLDQVFERMGAHLAVGEMQIEEDAGLGMGVTLMLLATVAGTFFCKGSKPRRYGEGIPGRRIYQYAVLVSAWCPLLAFMAVSGASTPARLALPFYAPLLPLCLMRQSGDWIRRNRWWKATGLGVFALAAGMVIITPARPLWPAQSVLSRLKNNPAARRAEAVYSVYNARPEAFAPARERLPADAGTVGIIAFDYPETSLWKPFFSRRIKHVIPTDTAGEMAGRGIRYVLISSETLAAHYAMTVEDWVKKNHAEVVWTMPLRLRASREANYWTLAKLPSAETKSL